MREPDRGSPGPAGDHQPGLQDRRRQRGDDLDHRALPRGAHRVGLHPVRHGTGQSCKSEYWRQRPSTAHKQNGQRSMSSPLTVHRRLWPTRSRIVYGAPNLAQKRPVIVPVMGRWTVDKMRQGADERSGAHPGMPVTNGQMCGRWHNRADTRFGQTGARHYLIQG
jgi:hypothetical protein